MNCDKSIDVPILVDSVLCVKYITFCNFWFLLNSAGLFCASAGSYSSLLLPMQLPFHCSTLLTLFLCYFSRVFNLSPYCCFLFWLFFTCSAELSWSGIRDSLPQVTLEHWEKSVGNRCAAALCVCVFTQVSLTLSVCPSIQVPIRHCLTVACTSILV